MIYINKPSTPPSSLSNFKAIMKDLILRFGSYDNIPEDEKNKFINGYRHPEVRERLFSCSFGKCAYCELIPEGSSLRVEHFHPKSIYPEEILDWSNLLPSCEKCNAYKYTHDTKVDPIINPCETDPSLYFIYDTFRILASPTAPNLSLASKTINTCNLNRPELIKSRSNILAKMTDYINDIEDKIIELQSNPSDLIIRRRVLAIEESFDTIENMAEKDKHHSALIRYRLYNSLDISQKRNFLENLKTSYSRIFQNL